MTTSGTSLDPLLGVPTPPLILSEFNIGKIQSGACGATLQFINVLWHARLARRLV